MPIICLEGPSAVGKTTTARLLAREHGAVHIPEVQFLFERPEEHRLMWYMERQVERHRFAREKSDSGALVILDGDPLQPIWYNRLFPATNSSYPEVLSFYSAQFEQGTLGWPNKYVFLTTRVDELHKRKAGDPSRTRRNFEKHLALLDFLERYSTQLEQIAPNLVVRHVADSLENNAQVVLEGAKNLEAVSNLEVFDQITSWLLSTRAE